jgi:CDP-glycerol glycerophosphotransferase (TagB/SpsB family)
MIINKIKILLLLLVNIPLWLISKFITKDKNIWIFGAWSGKKYADNSKYFFEYVNEQYPNVKAIWVSDDNKIVQNLNSKGFIAYKKYSFMSIFYGVQAKYSIFVHSNKTDSLMFLNNKKTQLIQLWHGSPIKKIGKDDKMFQGDSLIKRITKLVFFPYLKEEKYAIFTGIGDEDSKIYATAFSATNIKSTGLCRNDKLFYKKKQVYYTVTYLPTFRDQIGDKVDLFSEYNFDLATWNEKLSKLSIVLNIKMHPVNKPKNELLDKFKNFKYINFLDEIDVAEVLANTDILITDYSSVFFDYLLTDNPIIFAPFDYEKYLTKDRELYYDYDEVTPGPKCKNWAEVLEWVFKFKDNSELYKDERKKVKDRFHKYHDNKSCDRVYKEIMKLS